jgi:hypothetical protein
MITETMLLLIAAAGDSRSTDELCQGGVDAGAACVDRSLPGEMAPGGAPASA